MRKLLPSKEINDNTGLSPFHFQASRATKDLPYATNGQTKRDLEQVNHTPEGPKLKRRVGDSTDGMRKRSHADLNDHPDRLVPTSDDAFATSESAIMNPSSSPPPLDCSSPPEHDFGFDDSACFVDDTKTEIKLSYSKLTSSITSLEERHANEIIRSAIDEANPTVSLSGMELAKVPAQVEDLNHMVNEQVDDEFMAKIRLFMDRNFLRELPPQLFNIENLTVLVLRNNDLDWVPPAIGKLNNLVELSISQNRLEYLPSEILDLEKLSIFSVHPNPLLDPPGPKKMAVSPNTTGATNTRVLTNYQLHIDQSPELNVSRLSESCQLAIGQATQGQAIKWTLSDPTARLIDEGRRAYDNQVRCGVCCSRMVRGVGHCYEWRDAVLSQCDVVFRRNFCTLKCVAKWRQSV